MYNIFQNNETLEAFLTLAKVPCAGTKSVHKILVLYSALRTNEPIEITYYQEVPSTLRKIGYRELSNGIRVCVGKQRGHYIYFNGC